MWVHVFLCFQSFIRSLSLRCSFELLLDTFLLRYILQRRAKLNVDAPMVPMEIRAEKALDAIYVCCFGRDPIEEQDQSLLKIMLSAVFPTVEQSKIQRIIKDKALKVAEGSDADSVPEPKPLSKEAVQMQMKDLEFLQQNREP